ncbi:hypothetical protein BDZ94DRAFT_1245345 [Collybia nuda]|uniref:Uncharacterized protein n=1 Tax=Collybia nuda TaxID=64659 RepID=A0A9P5YI42_9AGAR|nr:hypothetical protein BDZ94DRAFT_1245345 [Collybia nuda]
MLILSSLQFKFFLNYKHTPFNTIFYSSTMCYAYGSIDQAVNACPMCKVFPHTRCPHQRDICRNRTLHPRIDVLFLKNAEVDSFNGCGYCKWARTGPSPKQAGYHNPGWPGCCRPPTISEHRMIQAADWRSVSIIHQVPIPTEIKAALDSLGPRGSPVPILSSSAARTSTGSKASMPAFDRRNSGNSSPRSGSVSGRTASMSISGKVRGSSPKQAIAALGNNLSRTSSGNTISTSVPTSSSMEQHHTNRRQALLDPADKRSEGPYSSQSSPSRKNVDLESPRRNSSRGPSVTPATPSVSLSKVVVNSRPQASVRRRNSISNSSSPVTKSSPPQPRLSDRPSFVIPRAPRKEGDMLSSASSSSGSSDGIGSMTDSTITSDGGFTDYLSDESEAELQRQAEARAALVAQNQAEELEFKAARQQLAHVDLRPPKSWNPTNITNSTTTRLPSGPGTTFSGRSVPITMAHVAQTRG